jgi:hypothetical protein
MRATQEQVNNEAAQGEQNTTIAGKLDPTMSIKSPPAAGNVAAARS